MNYIPSHIYRLRGADSGPVVTLLGGTHGDERIGVQVIALLTRHLGVFGEPHGTEHTSAAISGMLYVGIGNPKAVVQGTRGADSGPDLNRSFDDRMLFAAPAADDSYDLRRARELMRIFDHTDYLVDLHCTTQASVPFVCMGSDSVLHRAVYAHIPVEHVLTDPDNILTHDVGGAGLTTTDRAVDTHGGSAFSVEVHGERRGVGLCYETGERDDVGKAEGVFLTVLHVLSTLGVLTAPTVCREHGGEQRVYRLTHMVQREQDDFVFARHLTAGFAPVRAGEELGRYVKTGATVHAPDSGVLVFQSATLRHTASRSLCYVAQALT